MRQVHGQLGSWIDGEIAVRDHDLDFRDLQDLLRDVLLTVWGGQDLWVKLTTKKKVGSVIIGVLQQS